MKALLLDPVTTKVVSMVYSQTQILEQEVYLVEQLGKAHEAMPHLKAAVFLQPTEANFDLLLREIRDPKFAESHVFFSYVLSVSAMYVNLCQFIKFMSIDITITAIIAAPKQVFAPACVLTC